jgi:hypothetical protein
MPALRKANGKRQKQIPRPPEGWRTRDDSRNKGTAGEILRSAQDDGQGRPPKGGRYIGIQTDLLVAEGDERVDAHGAARGNERGEKRDAAENNCDA